MSSSQTKPTLSTCPWCGRNNPELSPTCTNCGEQLDAEPGADSAKAPARSQLVAVLLALALGPLGLVYLRAWGTAFWITLIGLPFVLTHTGGLWITIGARLICASLAYGFASEQIPNPKRDASRLLEKASRLEDTDRPQAIAIYEEIVRSYPGTTAGKEAARNLETLSRNIK